MKYTEFTGKTVEEAVEKGLQELSLTKETADVRVLEEGKKKLFGFVKARVEIAPLCDGCKETENGEACVLEKAEEKTVCAEKSCACTGAQTDGERTVEFLEGLFAQLKITACAELVSEGDKIEINVTATNTTAVIGKHGATLDAIQTLAGAVANIGREEYKRVVVDCENYRENRESTLQKLAENLAQKATRLGKKVKLEPMNPYERRIIHSALSEIDGVKTESEGKEPNRYIVIIPDNLVDPNEPAIQARADRRERSRGGKGGYGERGRRSSGGFNRGASRDRGYKKSNRDGRESRNSAPTGGTAMKPTDFFGIFLGNSGNKEE